MAAASGTAAGGPEPGQEGPPGWLAAAFPDRQWQSLRSCSLVVDEVSGAGLDFEASRFGYVVESVGERPGQDAALRPGVTVVAIGGAPLIGLDEDALEAAFGAEFRDSAPLWVLSTEELQAAASAQEASDVVLEHGSVMHVPLCSAAVLGAMHAAVRAALGRDLTAFTARTGVRSEVACPEGSPMASVVLCGVPEEVRAARSELSALLWQYRARSAVPVPRVEENAEELEVDGMVVRSLPPRNRRRRRAADEDMEGGNDSGKKAALGDEAPGDHADQPGSGPGAAELEGGSQPEASKEVRYFEFMDHTADVILHSWGRSLSEAFAQVCVAFFSYMTELDRVELETSVEVEASGHDILDLLYHLLDEFLFSFGTEFIICRRVEILSLDVDGLKVRAKGFGERFDLEKHPQGTEIKAITMHQMKILTPETLTSEDGVIPRKESAMEGGTSKEGFPFECYVLVDI